jgi:hypothetical protein
MSLDQRRDLISQLEAVRNSRVLSYFLSDRETFPPSVPGYSTILGTEPQLLFIDQLRSIGRTRQIDLFLYTRGGDTNAVWPLISLLREYCEKLTVIVPSRAHSGGTLICLGANEVVMTQFAELSPIDPTVGNQFNPVDPRNPQNVLGISVEDVAAYFDLCKGKDVGIKDERNLLEALKELTAKVNPLALGNVQRVYLQIRMLAEKLLLLHMDSKHDADRIKKIIEALTTKFYSHVHAITRKEAIPLLGDWVRSPTEEEEPFILALFDSYAETLELRNRFNLPQVIGDEPTHDFQVIGAFIESRELAHIHILELRVMQRPNLPPGVQVQVPPGQPLPLVPWVGRAYDFGIRAMGWRVNSEGV